jgi:hypothetical protein
MEYGTIVCGDIDCPLYNNGYCKLNGFDADIPCDVMSKAEFEEFKNKEEGE